MASSDGFRFDSNLLSFISTLLALINPATPIVAINNDFSF